LETRALAEVGVRHYITTCSCKERKKTAKLKEYCFFGAYSVLESA